ncbi:DUF1444 family protein [Caldalkalibacillus salinus]|uniref:DUF1444 family protein n=1 Tax=Caldalkalibacillus salinus TaxID=2803787 RepID=UPI001920C1D2
MRAKELQEHLQAAFETRGWQAQWDREQDQFTIDMADKSEPIRISVPKMLERINKGKEDVDTIINESLDNVESMIQAVEERRNVSLEGNDTKIFPVMRSTSFPTETKDGKQLIYEEHTAESRVYYAIDLGQTYILIDEDMMYASHWEQQTIKEKALFNLRRLPNEAKQDTVSGNVFYFINVPDGYAASRILNQALINEYAQKVEGDLCIAIPHQDVLILADLRNTSGYDVMGQMGFHFYANGPMPITALPFKYVDGQLEPIFILARRKTDKKDGKK